MSVGRPGNGRQMAPSLPTSSIDPPCSLRGLKEFVWPTQAKAWAMFSWPFGPTRRYPDAPGTREHRSRRYPNTPGTREPPGTPIRRETRYAGNRDTPGTPNAGERRECQNAVSPLPAMMALPNFARCSKLRKLPPSLKLWWTRRRASVPDDP